jgi:hypothetical protein
MDAQFNGNFANRRFCREIKSTAWSGKTTEGQAGPLDFHKTSKLMFMKTPYKPFIIPALCALGVWSQIVHQSQSTSPTSMLMLSCMLQLEVKSQS